MREVGCRTYKQSSSGKRSFGWSAMPGERNKPDEIARALCPPQRWVGIAVD